MSTQRTSLEAARGQVHSGGERLAYPVNEACHAMGIKRSLLYELIRRREIEPVKIAGRTLIPRSEIERLTTPQRAA